jgi:hypothetical protein
VRLTFKSISVAVVAAGCLALAACSSSMDSQGSGTANGPGGNASGQSGQPGAGHAGGPVTGGTVTVKQGNKVICVMKVVNGTGTCQVPAKKIGTGTSQLVGVYKGTGYRSSQSRPVSVTVTKGR